MVMMGSSLADKLQAFRAAMFQRMSVRDLDAWHEGEAQLLASDAAAGALQAGDAAPDFSLPDQHGRVVSLADRLAQGPVALFFNRGGWCPFCALSLRAWQDALPALHEAGGDVLAITPQPAMACSQYAERDLLSYSLLSDRENAVAERYGVWFEPPEILRSLLARLGHDIPRINGTGNWRMPLGATFVLAEDGRIALAHVETIAWRQLEPSAAIKAVQNLRRLTTS